MKPYIRNGRAVEIGDLFCAGRSADLFRAVFGVGRSRDRSAARRAGFFVDVDHPRAGRLRQPGPPYDWRIPWWKVRRRAAF